MERDEKVCPYCAEVIKAAAVRCRYCQSDLPASEPAGEPASEPAGEPAEPEAEPAATAPHAPTISEDLPDAVSEAAPKDRVAVTLAVVSVLLVGALVAIFTLSGPGDLALADNGQVTAANARSAAMSAASADVTTILSYGYKTLDQDEASARKVLTPEYFKTQYQGPMTTRKPKIARLKLTQVAKVLSVSLVSLTPGHAKVMLLTNIVNVPEGSKSDPPQTLSRLLVVMEQKDGEWVVSKMAGF